MQEIIISEAHEGQRLNKFLGNYLDNAPQSFLYKMLRKKNIKWNNGKAEGNEILRKGDSVKIFMSDETIAKFRKDGKVPDCSHLPVAISKGDNDLSVSREEKETKSIDKREVRPLEILYEDRDMLILNKPTDVLSQKAQPSDYSLNEQIVDYYNRKTDSDKLFTPSVCNRLDRNTSGIILAGMSLKGSRSLSFMLKERTLDKYYLTVVSGKIPYAETVQGYLTKQSSHNRVVIYPSREAAEREHAEKISYIETKYEPVAYGDFEENSFTLLRVKLITGKTHQIRAHLQSIGYPIIGDGKYGSKQINNKMWKEFHLKHQLLHAYCLLFPENVLDLSKEMRGFQIKADPPVEFCEIVSRIFHIDREKLKEIC